jgi:hypothetical protein
MASPADILWGKYKTYRGPFYLGVRRFKLPPKPTENEMLMAVLTATEGGRADAINMYDRCIISTGYIQWCEAKYFLTSKLLGALADHNPTLLDPLQPALEASGAVFAKTAHGRWRFRFNDPRGEVDAGAEQKQLFLLNSSGHKGDWDDESKAHAKLWAASMSNVLNQDEADAVQMDYVANRMMGFATNKARKVLFDGTPSTGWTGALRAIYLSFAGNLPAVASKQLTAALGELGTTPKWTKDWCIHITRRLTFGPNIAIYPHRYQAIRPVVERLYGVDLPDMAEELKAWSVDMEMEDPTWDEIVDEEPVKEPTFTTTREVQQLLSDMGYDLGEAGVDGWMGRKTRDAIITFQGLNGLTADGIVGPKTRAKMLVVWRAKVCC